MCLDNHDGMISTGETPDSSTRALWQSHLVAKQEDLCEGNYEFGLRNIFVILRSDFLHAVKYCDMRPTALVPSEGRRTADFVIASKNPPPRPGLNPLTLGSNSKHPNHYTTEATAGSGTFLALLSALHPDVVLIFSPRILISNSRN
jgi:hypothetical protein